MRAAWCRRARRAFPQHERLKRLASELRNGADLINPRRNSGEGLPGRGVGWEHDRVRLAKVGGAAHGAPFSVLGEETVRRDGSSLRPRSPRAGGGRGCRGVWQVGEDHRGTCRVDCGPIGAGVRGCSWRLRWSPKPRGRHRRSSRSTAQSVRKPLGSTTMTSPERRVSAWRTRLKMIGTWRWYKTIREPPRDRPWTICMTSPLLLAQDGTRGTW